MNTCNTPQCSNNHYAKGLCKLHYQRHKRGTNLNTPLRRKEKHGMAGSRTYISWQRMIQRCYNPLETNFKNWGGRGITVCDEWRESFNSFYKDMGDRPLGTSIDRIDNSKGYFKENCKWSTRREQNINKRMQSNNTSGTVGVIFYKNGWQANAFGKYLGRYKTKEDAVAIREQYIERIMN